MSEFDNALENVRDMKADNGFIENTRKTIKGSALGLVGGLMFAWYYQKNIYVYGLLGAIGGGVINYMLLGNNFFEKKENEY